MLDIALNDHREWAQYKKLRFGNLSFEFLQLKNCMSKLCTIALHDPAIASGQDINNIRFGNCDFGGIPGENLHKYVFVPVH